ncbi:MAG: CapA family protein [Tissierellaceae bacterium]
MKRRYSIPILSLGLFVFILGLGAYLKDPIENVPDQETAYIEASPLEDKEDELEVIEEEKESLVRLVAVGDLMFHMPQNRAAYDKEKGLYDYSRIFQQIKPYIEGADIAIGNFETVTAGGELGYSGYPRFNTPKESLLAIKETGFHILSTANNHCLDQGARGIINTIDNIHELGMKNIGTYKSPEDNEILVEEVNSIRMGFLAYTYGLNGLDYLLSREELSYMINLIDEERIRSDIERAKDMDLDLIVVSIHWGNEYQRKAHTSQIELGEKIIEWGGDIVLGSHPHVIQDSQIIERDGQNKFIIYSLGNFVSNQRQETMGNSYTEDGLIVEIEIEKDLIKGETRIRDIHFIPTWVYRYREEDKWEYEILPISDLLEDKDEVFAHIRPRLEKSYRDTMEKVTENSLYSELN